MKTKVYIRIARNGRIHVTASVKPNHAPISTAGGKVLPTVAFAVEFNIPDKLFEQAEQVIAEVEIPESQATIAAEVRKSDEDIYIEHLLLPVRAFNCLYRANIRTLGDLVNKTESELIAIPNMDASSLAAIKEELAARKLSLRAEEN